MVRKNNTHHGFGGFIHNRYNNVIDPIKPRHHIENDHHLIEHGKKEHGFHKKPLYQEYHLNPTQSVATGTILRKHQDRVERKDNQNMMNQAKIHVGKTGFYVATDKFVYGRDPTIMNTLKELLVFAMGDLFVADKISEMTDGLLSQVIKDESQRDLVARILSNVLLSSLIEMKLPGTREFILNTVPEVASDLINSRIVSGELNRLESRFLDRKDFDF